MSSTYNGTEAFQMKKPSVERALEDILNIAGKVLPFYELFGLLTAPRCEECGDRKVFILGFDYCLKCKNAVSQVFLAF
jgi:hypothetical protein